MNIKLYDLLPRIKPFPLASYSFKLIDVYLVMFARTEVSSSEYLITVSKKAIKIWRKGSIRGPFANVTDVTLPPNSVCNCMTYYGERKLLFIGLTDGYICWYDFFSKSENMVSLLAYCKVYETKVIKIIEPQSFFGNMLSCDAGGNFMSLMFPIPSDGKPDDLYKLDAKCTVVEHDVVRDKFFIGQKSGQISVLRRYSKSIVFQGFCKTESMLRDHQHSVSCVKWVERRHWVVGGFTDGSIIVFKMGRLERTHFQLTAHEMKITSLMYIHNPPTLVSSATDWAVLAWDCNPRIKRTKQPELITKPRCNICNRPAKWNLMDRAVEKRRGYSLQHCRHCGNTICDKCSTEQLDDPGKGFELPVHTCKLCYANLANRIPTTVKNYIPVKIMSVDYIARPPWFVASTGYCVGIWNYGRHLKRET